MDSRLRGNDEGKEHIPPVMPDLFRHPPGGCGPAAGGGSRPAPGWRSEGGDRHPAPSCQRKLASISYPW